MDLEERVKAKLLSRGFTKELLLNNRGLIGAAIDETQEVVKNINYDTVLQTVPYQLCPKCGGDGEVLVNNWNGSPTSISTGMQTCDLCGGAKIIPQHIVPIEHKISK